MLRRRKLFTAFILLNSPSKELIPCQSVFSYVLSIRLCCAMFEQRETDNLKLLNQAAFLLFFANVQIFIFVLNATWFQLVWLDVTQTSFVVFVVFLCFFIWLCNVSKYQIKTLSFFLFLESMVGSPRIRLSACIYQWNALYCTKN